MKVNWILAVATTIVAVLGSTVTVARAETFTLSDYEAESQLVSHAGCSTCGAATANACGCESACDLGCDEPWRLFPELPGGVTITGWAAGGATANADHPASRFNGPLSFGDRQEVMLNQLYFVMERAVDGSQGLDIGGRIDVLFGTDYVFTMANGLETRRNGANKWNSRRFYGVALPQAYLEVASGDLSVKLGHFYTIIGNEVVTAPGNFFYSHAYTMQYGEPFTHTGMIATYKWSDRVNILGGFSNGWDNFDRASERLALLHGFSWTSIDGRTTLAAAVTSGDEFNPSNVYTNRTMYSLVATRQVTDRLQYVLQHDHGWQKDYFSKDVDAEWYGINQYLFYDINDCWKAGLRVEWFRDDDGVRVSGVRASNPINGASFVGNFYEITAGLNWIPNNNLIVRPEVRWDWFDGTAGGPLPYDDGTKDNQFVAGFDAILTF